MKHLLYLPLWFARNKFGRQKRPLQSVIFISNECNLQCRHCCVYAKDNGERSSFEAVRQDLEYCYKQGSRFVDFEGGEPMIWHDNVQGEEKNINDLLALAKEIGFYSTTVTTNAQIPFDWCLADSIWISLDGVNEFHDKIRGQGAFANLCANIDNNPHPRISANMVVNNLNYTNVNDTIDFVIAHPHLNSISINLHTPFPGTEDLTLSDTLRKEVLANVIQRKKNGDPIMNSVSGLKAMLNMDFKKYCWMSNFVMLNHTYYPACQGEELGLCDKCGFSMAGEMYSVMNLKPDTILAGIKLRIQEK